MNIKLEVTPWQFQEIVKKGYSLDIIFLLTLIQENCQEELENGAKLNALRQSLNRKGLVSDSGELTLQGKELLSFLLSATETKLTRIKPKKGAFEDFWKTYPGTDMFEYKGRKFTGVRSLKADKENCRVKFEKILLEGEYTPEIIIEALKLDIFMKKEASIKEGKNKLTYLQNSLTYLNQRSYEPFIELVKQGIKVEEPKTEYDGVNI